MVITTLKYIQIINVQPTEAYRVERYAARHVVGPVAVRVVEGDQEGFLNVVLTIYQ